MSRTSRHDEAARRTREVAHRAVRRLELVEWALLAGAMAVALLGGALTAALLAAPLGVSFRVLWVIMSLMLFAVPGGLALRREKLKERSVSQTPNEIEESDV